MSIIREERNLVSSVAAQRFHEKCVDVLPSGCRIWMGAVNENGYGTLMAWGRHYKAHRAAWEIEFGEAPRGFLLHRCDVPSCVNPAHLFEGSQAENMADMHRKGRGHIPTPRGEKQGSAKLTESCVREIRRRADRGESNVSIAKDFCIHPSNVGVIKRRQGWRHVCD